MNEQLLSYIPSGWKPTIDAINGQKGDRFTFVIQ